MASEEVEVEEEEVCMLAGDRTTGKQKIMMINLILRVMKLIPGLISNRTMHPLLIHG